MATAIPKMSRIGAILPPILLPHKQLELVVDAVMLAARETALEHFSCPGRASPQWSRSETCGEVAGTRNSYSHHAPPPTMPHRELSKAPPTFSRKQT
jgi:hypothetical protein